MTGNGSKPLPFQPPDLHRWTRSAPGGGCQGLGHRCHPGFKRRQLRIAETMCGVGAWLPSPKRDTRPGRSLACFCWHVRSSPVPEVRSHGCQHTPGIQLTLDPGDIISALRVRQVHPSMDAMIPIIACNIYERIVAPRKDRAAASHQWTQPVILTCELPLITELP